MPRSERFFPFWHGPRDRLATVSGLVAQYFFRTNRPLFVIGPVAAISAVLIRSATRAGVNAE